MAEMQNLISAGGATWSGSAPAANAISASGATWSAGGANAAAAGSVALGGFSGGTIAVAGGGGGMLPLTGAARVQDGALVPSTRRIALPGDSRNGGRLVQRH